MLRRHRATWWVPDLDRRPWPPADATWHIDVLFAPSHHAWVLVRAWATGDAQYARLGTDGGSSSARIPPRPDAPPEQRAPATRVERAVRIEEVDALVALARAAIDEPAPVGRAQLDGMSIDVELRTAEGVSCRETPIWHHAPLASALATWILQIGRALSDDECVLALLATIQTRYVRGSAGTASSG